MLVCLVLLAPQGCHLPDLCAPEAAAPLPADFNGMVTPQSSAQISIDEFFGDPRLTQLIMEGLSRNQELKIRNQEVVIASNEILARRGAYLPFVTVGGRGGVERTSKYTPLGAAEEELEHAGGGHFPDPLPNTEISANLFWEVDIWRQLRNARDAAKQRYVEAIESRNYYITRLVAEVAEKYYELAALDKRLEFLEQTITIQKQSLEVAQSLKEAARGTELGVQRFQAEVRKNESQRLIVQQKMIEVENRINFLTGRFPQRVDREAWDYIRLDSQILSVGVPAQLLMNRRDIRAAEREIAASGLDVLVARAEFYPRLSITAGVGFEAFNPRYLFEPGAFIGHAFGELVAPLINKKAIRAEYLSANARQLQAVYDYQRTVLDAFTEVVNLVSRAENYRRSVALKQQQVEALEESVDVATNLFQGARAEYIDVLFSQRDLLEARTVLIETKQEQLAAIVNAWQALGGGFLLSSSGQEVTDLFCMPLPIAAGEVIIPRGAVPVPVPEIDPPAPGPGTEPAPGSEPLSAQESAPVSPPVPAAPADAAPAPDAAPPAPLPSALNAPADAEAAVDAKAEDETDSADVAPASAPVLEPVPAIVPAAAAAEKGLFPRIRSVVHWRLRPSAAGRREED